MERASLLSEAGQEMVFQENKCFSCPTKKKEILEIFFIQNPNEKSTLKTFMNQKSRREWLGSI